MTPLNLMSLIRITTIVFTCCLHGSGASLSGLVKDASTGQEIVGATVRLPTANLVTVSDEDGLFRIDDIVTLPVVVEVTALGYEPTIDTFFTLKGSDTVLICLTQGLVELPCITVTASRSEYPRVLECHMTEVVTAQDIRTRSASTTADCLSEEPGIAVQKTTHGHGSPILRGLMGTYVLLQYNGVRLNKSTFRFGPNQYLGTTDEFGVSEIEVVNGPASVLYGSDAIGGTINLRTQSRFTSSTALAVLPEATLRYSSADNSRIGSFSASMANDRLYATARVSSKRFDDLRAGGDIGTERPTAWRSLGGSATFAYRFNNSTEVSANYLSVRQRDIPRYDKVVSGSYMLFDYDCQDRDLAVLRLRKTLEQGPVRSFECNLSVQRELEVLQEQRTNSDPRIESQDRVTTWGGTAQLATTLARAHSLIAGGELYTDRVNSSRYALDSAGTIFMRPSFPDKSSYSSFGLFTEYRWDISSALRVRSGLRYSWFALSTRLEPPFGETSQNFDNATASLGIVHGPAHGLILFANYALGFRAPNLDDAAVLRTTSSGIDAPNPNLIPEHARYLEIGARASSHSWSVEAAGFLTRMTDLIDRRPGTFLGLSYFDSDGDGIQDPAEPDIFQKVNVGEGRIMGAEARFMARPVAKLDMYGFATWTWGKSLSGNEPMSRIPPIFGQFGFRTDLFRGGYAELFSRFAGPQRRVSARDRDDSRIGPNGTDGWTTVNARLGIGFGNISVQVLLENMLNKEYKTHGSGIHGSGRNLVATLSYGS